MTFDNSNYKVRRGLESEDGIVADNFYEMWLDICMKPDDIFDNWKEIFMESLKEYRRDLKCSTIVVVNELDEVVGSCVCQIYSTTSLHPDVIKRSTYQGGYLWGVFVKPEYRNKGLGKIMISGCTEYFKEIGCSEAKLWASEKGKPIYKHNGYEFIYDGVQEMVLSLKDNK
jgi:GNAT superfamily N-acetyltransferase